MDGIERCIDDEIPFEIPDTWVWQKLQSIAFLQTGTTPPTDQALFFGSGIPFIKPADIENSGINYCNESLTLLGAEKGRLIDAESVLMVCIGGSIGKCYYSLETVCCNQQINAATPILCNVEYLCYALQSDYFQATVRIRAGGTATPIINKTLWGRIYVPIPPLKEQYRIVRKAKELLETVKAL